MIDFMRDILVTYWRRKQLGKENSTRETYYKAIVETEIHDRGSLYDSTNAGGRGSHSKLNLKLDTTGLSVGYTLGMEEKTVIYDDPKIWSEPPLGSWNGHKADVGKTAGKTFLYKRCFGALAILIFRPLL